MSLQIDPSLTQVISGTSQLYMVCVLDHWPSRTPQYLTHVKWWNSFHCLSQGGEGRDKRMKGESVQTEGRNKPRGCGQSWSWGARRSDSWYCQLGRHPSPPTFTIPRKMNYQHVSSPASNSYCLSQCTTLPSLQSSAGDASSSWKNTCVKGKHFLQLRGEFSFTVWYLIEWNSQPFVHPDWHPESREWRDCLIM